MTTRSVSQGGSRIAFVTQMCDAFEKAGAQYVLLHDHDDGGRDSDIDIAVSRPSLDSVDTLIRLGCLGRLLQRIDYDIPWCRFYVVQTRDVNRPYRQVDVACDPWGIGRYGPAPHVALASRQAEAEIYVPSPAAQALYLAVKRSRKGLRGQADEDALTAAFERDRSGATALLERHFELAGADLAEALGDPTRDIGAALSALGHHLDRQRRWPTQVARRIAFGVVRTGRRALRPTGLVVCLAGPDGTGKSTLAAELAATEGLFRRSRRLHLTPGVLPPPGRLLGRSPGDVSKPHSRDPSGPAGSWARVAYLAADTTIGWPKHVSAPRARSTLVLLERGWNDLTVDPRRYRLGAGMSFARALGSVLPKPDMTLLLEAPPSEIYARKPELETAEISRQLAAWRVIAEKAGDRFRTVSAATRARAREAALEAIEDHLAERLGDLGRFDTALSCLGQPSTSGTRFSVVTGRGRPRWVVPSRLGAAGPLGTRLYRPASGLHHVGAVALETATRAGIPRGAKLELDTSSGLGPELAAALGLHEVELAARLPTDPTRSSRAVLTVLHGGRPVAMVKVEPQGSPELARELNILSALETSPLETIVTPRVLASFPWRGHDVLAMSVLSHRGQTSRAPAQVEERALVELASLTERLAAAVGDGQGATIAHGDFCGWNSSRLPDGRLAIWDWEWAHLGEPLEDWFHWETQRLIAFASLSLDDLVRSAFVPSAQLRRLCSALGIDPGAAPSALHASLRQGIDRRLGTHDGARGFDLRMQALELLEGRS